MSVVSQRRGFAVRRLAWQPLAVMVVALGAAPTLAAGQSPVTSGVLLGTPVDVTKPIASPLVKLSTNGQVDAAQLFYRGPSGQTFVQFFTTGSATVRYFPKLVSLQAYYPAPSSSPLNPLTFSLYTQPGTWSLTDMQLYTATGFFDYSGSALAALFPSLSFTIINPNKPDFVAPVILSASIKTPSISLSKGQPLVIDARVKDDVSGIASIGICGIPSGGGFASICPRSQTPTHPVLSGTFALSNTPFPNVPTGTYTVHDITLQDIAGNVAVITDATAITNLFAGKTTFTVTN